MKGDILTLKLTKSWTVHVKIASRPTGTVMFVIGALKLGSTAMRIQNVIHVFRTMIELEKKLINTKNVRPLTFIKSYCLHALFKEDVRKVYNKNLGGPSHILST